MTGHPLGRVVMVPAAQSLGGIAAIRSLGRAGYAVHAVAPTADALGLHSRFATATAVHPPLGSGAFDDWFTNYVARHSVELVMPGGGIAANGPGCLPRFAHMFPTSSDQRLLDLGESKFLLFEALLAAGGAAATNLPPCRLVEFPVLPGADELESLGFPLFLKLDAVLALPGTDGPAQVIRSDNATAAVADLARLAPVYRGALVQGFVPGQGAGVFLLRWNGRIIARMMHLRLHEMPHTGGASSLRMSWWHDAMMADAIAKLEAIDWQGVAMVEYRWDPATDAFCLMEMNLRFWGSMHLALYAGADFPALLADAFFGKVPPAPVEGQRGVVCRHLVPFELGYLTSLLRDPDVRWTRKLAALGEAIVLTCDPRVRSDLLFPGDRGLFWRQLGSFLGLRT